jgi:hypothetical protein
MKRVVIGLAAVLILGGIAQQARADDYVALCKAGEKDNPDADKMCTCAAGKIAAGDRASAMAAMKVMNDALVAGKTPDPSSMPADLSKGMQAAMTAEAGCM